VQRIHGLAREHGAEVLDGTGDHHRHAQAQFPEHVLDRDQGRLRVPRVEAGLHQQQVGAPEQQALDLHS
jgi:hypothetical protein